MEMAAAGATLYTLDDWRKLRPDPSPAPSRRSSSAASLLSIN